jgi:hypothetical protein
VRRREVKGILHYWSPAVVGRWWIGARLPW